MLHPIQSRQIKPPYRTKETAALNLQSDDDSLRAPEGHIKNGRISVLDHPAPAKPIDGRDPELFGRLDAAIEWDRP